MALIIDSTAAHRAVPDDEFRLWASELTLFLSSVMGELAAERKHVVAVLEEAGFNVRWFEGFGGTDDPPDRAYLTEVAASDIYIGVVADDYGAMQRSGYSATHEEYLEARRTGRRVSFWVRADAGNRDGHARKFVSEVYVFNTAGRWTSADDLASGILNRLKQMAAEDLSPWVKVGDTVFRATEIVEAGGQLVISARIRAQNVMNSLRGYAPEDRWGLNSEVPITYGNRSGKGRVVAFEVQTQAAATQTATLSLKVEWAGGREDGRMGINGMDADDVTEAGIRAGYLHEPLPQPLRGLGMGSLADTTDPLTQLAGIQLPEGALTSIARLLAVEHLVGNRKVAAVEEFMLGPASGGRRRLRIAWRDPKVYANVEPARREVEGDRDW